MSRVSKLGHELYTGEVSFNIVGHRRRWYSVSAVFVIAALLSLFVRGLSLGIEFTGGAEFQVPSATCSIDEARTAVEATGVEPSTVAKLGNGYIRITTGAVEQAESLTIRQSVAAACDTDAANITAQVVGPTWGGEITGKALTALGVFLVLVSVFLAIYFDWRMAVSALVALAHDIILTIGVYSLLRFEVTPATVIGVLTILGYSLYDTVVVFDKVKENTRGILGQSRQTYSQAANLAVNQTLVRSVNTSIVALLPVGAILVVGAGILGAGTLKDLALALFVGIAAGTYSSVFIATPLLAQLMERDPQMQALARRVASRSGGPRGADRPAANGSGVTQADPASADPDAGTAADGGAEAVASSGAPAAGGSGGGTSDAMDRARARRAASGPRNQPKKAPRSKR